MTAGGANARAEQAIRLLGAADSYGLSPADYAVTVPTAAGDAGDAAARTAELVRFEMTLSARVLRYVRDAQSGRVDPNRISGYHDFPAKPLDLPGVLATLAHTNEVRTYLELRHPQNAEYQALRVELEALRASEEDDIVVDPKLLLKPGETSPELPKLLQIVARGLDDEFGGDHGETLAALGKSETYIPELVPVIKEGAEAGRAEARRRGRPAHRRGARRHAEGRPHREGDLRAGAIALAALRSRQPARLHQRAGLHRELSSRAARRS